MQLATARDDGAGLLTARVDGAALSSSGPNFGAGYSAGFLLVLAKDSDGRRAIGIAIDVTGPGTYVIGGPENLDLGYVHDFDQWVGVSGSLTLTTLSSTEVRGTFAFVAEPEPGGSATGTRTITDGVFRVPLGGASGG